jgi:hypothetical protein
MRRLTIEDTYDIRRADRTRRRPAGNYQRAAPAASPHPRTTRAAQVEFTMQERVGGRKIRTPVGLRD